MASEPTQAMREEARRFLEARWGEHSGVTQSEVNAGAACMAHAANLIASKIKCAGDSADRAEDEHPDDELRAATASALAYCRVIVTTGRWLPAEGTVDDG